MNLKIDTKIKSVSCIGTTKDKEGWVNVSLTMTFKVNLQDQVKHFAVFEVFDHDKVRNDTKIKIGSFSQSELRKEI